MRSLIILAGLLLFSCEKEWANPYEEFLLPEGQHSRAYKVELLQTSELDFEVIFDNSAIYETSIPENQWDTNKLMGFSNCNAQHHVNSARFGWRWLNDQLEILAYCYVDGERIIREIGTVTLNQPSHYNLTVSSDYYHFQLDDFPTVSIPRKSKCEIGAYYMLYPYFGGDETAPHDITIKIKRSF